MHFVQFWSDQRKKQHLVNSLEGSTKFHVRTVRQHMWGKWHDLQKRDWMSTKDYHHLPYMNTKHQIVTSQTLIPLQRPIFGLRVILLEVYCICKPSNQNKLSLSIIKINYPGQCENTRLKSSYPSIHPSLRSINQYEIQQSKYIVYVYLFL